MDDTAGIDPQLAPPQSHPSEQTAPGPRDRVPHDWQGILMRHRGTR